ncbi:hypothetical protein HIM_04041 [Hirsutella minnesotensis 3608]|uniref:Major facilitator superfamily (MFS) profile domain-containing protein n=1 Tax=Hirsutella minnesotensis 3608 TaxID=1043627 RepID=A0A0F7ZQ64_9HYPO|nr:hypothetical protein HIM_04041 [Hirsutella minnesotensis 3608]
MDAPCQDNCPRSRGTGNPWAKHFADVEMRSQTDGRSIDGLQVEKSHDAIFYSAALASPFRTEQLDKDQDDAHASPAKEAAPASWATMPNKDQLALIFLARLCETATNSSFQTYVVSQLRSFETPHGNNSSVFTLAFQLSVLNAVVAGPQLFTSILWGRLADSRHMGRKYVILVGLIGTGIGSLGLGASKSFAAMVFWRFVAGFINGNQGVMRAMIRDISGDRFESRAVLLMPAAFNVGSIVGPVIGGLLADPAGSFPTVFGSGGGQHGRGAARWLSNWPFALPNVVNGMCLILCAALVSFGLEETLDGVNARLALPFADGLKRIFGLKRCAQQYERLADKDLELEEQPEHAEKRADSRAPSPRIWTLRLVATLVARWLMTVHVSAYPSLLLVFIATPRYNPAVANNKLVVPKDYQPKAPFAFTGGLSFRPGDIAVALTIRGAAGLLLQLIFFPLLKNHFGLIRLYQYSLLLFPIAYFATPYMSIVPSSSLPPMPATGSLLWIIIGALLTIQTVARSFALPSSTMLLNAASPNKSTLGTINGIGQSVSAAARVFGPLLTAWLFDIGLKHGVIGISWWALAVIAAFAGLAGHWLKSLSRKETEKTQGSTQNPRRLSVSI